MNKRGTTMVEAAMIFPLIILAVIGVISIMVFFYNQVAVNARMHMVLRQNAGMISGVVENSKKIEGDFPIYKKGNIVYFQGGLTFNGNSILLRQNSVLYGSAYVVRGKEIVRYADLL